MSAPTLVVHIDAEGHHDYLIFGAGDCRFLVVDERCPHDRVYALTVRSPRHQLDELIGESMVGSAADERHAAVTARIVAELRGEPHLRTVEPG